MKIQQQSDRKRRVRLLIQAGGLLQKSGLMDVFGIESSDDLQDYENFEKAARLLGFLSECFEKSEFNDDNFERWYSVGSRFLKYD